MTVSPVYSFLFFIEQNLNSSGKNSSSVDGPKFPGDKASSTQNNNQQKKGIQVLPDGKLWFNSYWIEKRNTNTKVPISR